MPEPYITSILPRWHRSVLGKLRCGTLSLEIERGRFSRPKTPLADRICRHCNSHAVEDEVHFLVNCPYYSDLRYDLLISLIQILLSYQIFTKLHPFYKLKVLLNHWPLWYAVCIGVNYHHYNFIDYIPLFLL